MSTSDYVFAFLFLCVLLWGVVDILRIKLRYWKFLRENRKTCIYRGHVLPLDEVLAGKHNHVKREEE